MSKARWKERAKAIKAFKQSSEGQYLVNVALAAYKDKLTDRLEKQHKNKQGKWKRLDREYQSWKSEENLSDDKWKATGKLLKSVIDNPPKKLGTRKKVRFGINFYNYRAFLIPNALKKRKGIKKKQFKNIYYKLNNKRPFFVWEREEMPAIIENVQDAMDENIERLGLKAGRR